MPDGKPSKAPLIIFGTLISMSVVTVTIVFVTHSQRTEPYLDTKARRVRTMRRPPAASRPSANQPPSAAKALVPAHPIASPDAGPTPRPDSAASGEQPKNTE